jgi:hypothetical protein
MKVLIFGVPRSGTSSLFNFLVNSFPKKYKAIYEPFKTNTDIEFEYCIVKTVLTDNLLLKDNETLIEHSNRIIKSFDKVIYIKRKNIENTIQSLSDFQRPDLSKEISDVVARKNIKDWTNVFDILTKDKKVYYYEDIYQDTPSLEFNEMCEYLGIEISKNLFDKIIHPINKEFDEKKEKSII